LLRIPLVWVLLSLGGLTCVGTFRALQKIERRASKSESTP
jgi:hypothetical protein